MADEPTIPAPADPPVPAPKPPRRTGTSADDVSNEAERERRIAALEKKISDGAAENQSFKDQLAALIPKTTEPGAPQSNNPVVRVLREIGIIQ